MSEEHDSLYVYGIAVKEAKCSWAGIGVEGSYVFMLAEGDLTALVHKCSPEPYMGKEPEKVKELVISHNSILEKAMEVFGGVLPFPFNTIIKEKDGKNAEENLRDWLKKEKSRLEHSWEKLKGKREYGIKLFYERKYWIEDIRANSSAISGDNSGLNYLLKEKQNYEIKDKVIQRINEKRQEFFEAIKPIVQELKIEQPKVELMEDEKDMLLCVSVLADEPQFNELRRYLRGNVNLGDYRLAGPFPPYSFANGDAHG